MNRAVPPPGGMAPPTAVTSSTGRELDLPALAREACRAYDALFPDERERYGPAGMQWCLHDNQHLLNWAALSLAGYVEFDEQLAWLARVLEARDFPLARLARNLELLAQAVRASHPDEGELSTRLELGAGFVRAQRCFLQPRTEEVCKS